jgi:ABC-type Zn uptake system ZnuABC Zn-binding protein ZnuA/ABC-type Mn2+/Zn2+ transport system permease subunit
VDFLTSPFELHFVQRGLFEVLLLSFGAGLLGTWIVLRGLAFYSHAVGTAAFPGLVLADGLGFAAPIGALAAALVFAVALERLGRRHRSGYDSLTALVLAGSLALGVILASDIFHSGSNIESLLFGSLLLIQPRDLVIAAAATALAAIATASLGRAWLVTGFDPTAARALGVRSGIPEALLLGLIALTVIASVSAVGALLVTAILVTPAATVRIWSDRLSTWRAGTVVLTALEGTAGLWISVKTNAPPGATIAVLAGGAFAVAAVARALASSIAPRTIALGAAVLAVLALTSCGGGSGSSAAGNGKVDVVATTTQIGDWTREVGGAAVDVHQILKPNSDPHEYEPRPADVEATAGADVVFENGDNLDAWASKLVKEAGGSPGVVDLGKIALERLPGEKSGGEASRYDPHWWHDPRNAEQAVSEIRNTLVRVDPAKRGTFERSARSYLAKLQRLDREIEGCINRVSLSDRKLVTDHDAFGYFARRYRIRIVGAVIPSQTTEAQPSAGELAKLASLIKRERVRAVFPESSINPKLTRTIANETGASSDLTLYGDTLGPAGTDGGTYLEMEATNAKTIARGLSGGRVRCSIQAR